MGKEVWDQGGRRRIVPVPTVVGMRLEELSNASPFAEPQDFVFWASERYKVLDNQVINRALHRALASIGIDEQERRRRNIVFHSWRHFANTFLRGRVPEPTLRLVVGHSSEALSDHYTHVELLNIEDVRTVQEELF